jgi:cysteine desulfurase
MSTGSASGLYLDWNATSPPHPDVISAMLETARDTWGNPASVHYVGRRARAVVEGLRESLAVELEVEARDIIFTSGGTEANNLALAHANGLATSRLEHPSVVRVAEALEAAGRPVVWIPVPQSGRLEPSDIAAACERVGQGGTLALQSANHETGVVQPLAEAVELAHRAGLRVHVDAVQSFGKLRVPGLEKADTLSVAAHKVRGPKGLGALAFRERAPTPLLLGGAQERGLRPGTVDPVAAAGFHAALRRLSAAAAEWAALESLRDEFERALSPAGVRNGTAPRLPHVSNLSFAGARGDELVAALDLLGVRVSSGSACAAGTAEPSPVISAMLGRERAVSAVRASLGPGLDTEQMNQAIALFIRVVSSEKPEASRSA